MARLDILVHGGCLSEKSARNLAREIQHELPVWHINVRSVEKRDADSLGILGLPAFVLEGEVLVTGIPQKDWLLARLREWERGERWSGLLPAGRSAQRRKQRWWRMQSWGEPSGTLPL